MTFPIPCSTQLIPLRLVAEQEKAAKEREAELLELAKGKSAFPCPRPIRPTVPSLELVLSGQAEDLQKAEQNEKLQAARIAELEGEIMGTLLDHFPLLFFAGSLGQPFTIVDRQ